MITICPACGHPMILPEGRSRPWCSVYGTHSAKPDATELDRRYIIRERQRRAA